jgi:serine O-acetyltransferase
MTHSSLQRDDALWFELQAGLQRLRESEPLLRGYIDSVVADCRSLGDAVSGMLAAKLCGCGISREALQSTMAEAFRVSPPVMFAVRRDLAAILDRDPAARDLATAFLFHKGFHALQAHRVGHWLWVAGRSGLASLLQNRVSEVFAVDIHPAARIGCGVFIDHATGVVIGETATVGDDVSLLQDVTLGGTGKEAGDRHPKVENGVLLCAGAKVLGNIRIGEGAKVGAGSVVLDHVLPHTTVVGVPARVTNRVLSGSVVASMS